MSEDIWGQIEKEIIDQYLNDENPRPGLSLSAEGKTQPPFFSWFEIR